MRKVYLQFKKNGEYLSQNTFMAQQGFRSFGYEIEKFHFDEIETLNISTESIVVGHIGTIHKALKQLGIEPPLPLQPPKELLPFLGRNVWESTLGEIRKLHKTPVFIKPLYGLKSFTGYVVTDFKDLIRSAEFNDDFAVLAQDAIKLQSEWRVYVIGKEVKGIGHYNSGNPIAFPDQTFITETIEAYTSSPASYGIDFGVTSNNETVLIEVNDGFGLGNYGIVDYQYARFLEARWDELVSPLTKNNI